MGSWLEVLQSVPKYRANEPEPTPEPNLYEPNVQRLLQTVDSIYENSGNDVSNGGLYYCFTVRGANDWFRDFVIQSEQFSVKAIQTDLKIWGEKTILGQPYDPRMTARW